MVISMYRIRPTLSPGQAKGQDVMCRLDVERLLDFRVRRVVEVQRDKTRNQSREQSICVMQLALHLLPELSERVPVR